jgi:L-amino acid N-acyltransferase YncA
MNYKVEFLEKIESAFLWATVENAAAENAASYAVQLGIPFAPVRNDRIAVARNLDDEIVGFAVWRIDQPNGMAFIGLAWVRPDMRRKGVYREIVRQLRDIEATRHGLTGAWACVEAGNNTSLLTHTALMHIDGVIFHSNSQQ